METFNRFNQSQLNYHRRASTIQPVPPDILDWAIPIHNKSNMADETLVVQMEAMRKTLTVLLNGIAGASSIDDFEVQRDLAEAILGYEINRLEFLCDNAKKGWEAYHDEQ